MKTFNHIARLVRENRSKVKISQGDLARSVGFKNGQYISNIERALCGIPVNKIKKISEPLKISEDLIIEAMLLDLGEYLTESLRE